MKLNVGQCYARKVAIVWNLRGWESRLESKVDGAGIMNVSKRENRGCRARAHRGANETNALQMKGGSARLLLQ
jgi:hypothetical protein